MSSVSEREFDELIQATSPDVIKATLAVLHGFAEWLISEEIPIRAMYYSFPAPSGETVGARGYPVYYNAGFCGYSVDSNYLDYPVMQAEETIEAFSNQAPYFVFVKDHLEGDSTAARVRAVLLRTQGAAVPAPQLPVVVLP